MTTNATPGLSAEECAKSLEWLAAGPSFDVEDARRAMRDAAKLLAALRPAGPVGWQPIETAPKEEELVADVWAITSLDPIGERYANAIYRGGRWIDSGGNDMNWGRLDADGEPQFRRATHWMPLPLPPAAPPVEATPSGEEEIVVDGRVCEIHQATKGTFLASPSNPWRGMWYIQSRENPSQYLRRDGYWYCGTGGMEGYWPTAESAREFARQQASTGERP